MAATKFNMIEIYDILGIRLRWEDYSFRCSESDLSSVIFFEENPETYCVSSRELRLISLGSFSNGQLVLGSIAK